MVDKKNQKKIIQRSVDFAKDQLGDLHPVLKRVLLARGNYQVESLDRSLAKLPSPWLLSGMESMVAHLIKAIEQQQKILIVADFDADGATSCVVAIKGLTAMGAKYVDFIVPNRFEYGYGLTPEIVELAQQQKPGVIITVDNGISSLDGVKVAKALGIVVLVTDHHLPGDQLPTADAIVNPNQPDDQFPSSALAGVGVIFYVLMALRSRLREQSWFYTQQIPEPNLGELLDLVALGTIADVVPLDSINRCLSYQGLQRIRAGRCCVGIQSLIEISGRNKQTLSASGLGFALGPRINAAGRMDDMSLGIQGLLTDDPSLAKEIALQLDDLNSDRREIEGQMKQEALQLLQEMKPFKGTHIPWGVCLFDKRWHQGVIGILASRIKDKVHRPVIAFAPAGDDQIKGSARSIPDLHIRDVLSEVASRHPKLLSKFGGHAMAAGLTLYMHDYPAFALAFDEVVEDKLKDTDLSLKIHSDGQLEEADISIDFIELLDSYGPWGQTYPQPLFDGVFDVIQARIVGKNHLKMVLRYPFSERLFDAIHFFVDSPEFWLGVRQIKTVYQLDINEWRGQRNVQFIIRYLEKMA